MEQVKAILERHPNEPALVIGMYLDQLTAIAGPLGLPVITGTTPQRVRDRLYEESSRRHPDPGRIKGGELAVDLPEASLAIQVSGTFGSGKRKRSGWAGSSAKGAGKSGLFLFPCFARHRGAGVRPEAAAFLCEQGYAIQSRRWARLPAGIPRPATVVRCAYEALPNRLVAIPRQVAAWGELSIAARRTFLDGIAPGFPGAFPGWPCHDGAP